MNWIEIELTWTRSSGAALRDAMPALLARVQDAQLSGRNCHLAQAHCTRALCPQSCYSLPVKGVVS